jgi:crossover junction endodeoxyribonuclease RuvC
MRVLGIDPGSRITGYGIVESTTGGVAHVDNGNIAPPSSLALHGRLKFIFESLKRLIDEYRPDAVAIENVFVAKNVRSSLLLGHARGTAMIAASTADLDVAEYTPSEVKKAIAGTGGASKEQIQRMVKMLLKLPEVACEDASDALAVAICHCNCQNLADSIRDAIERNEKERTA